MQYSRLDDCKVFIEGDSIEVWYCRTTGPYVQNIELDLKNLESTHVLIGTIDGIVEAEGMKPADLVYWIYGFLQDKAWNRNGEAEALISNKGLTRTSFTVGDLIRFKRGKRKITFRSKLNGSWERF